MGKKKKSGHKDISRTEKIVFATAVLELIGMIHDVTERILSYEKRYRQGMHLATVFIIKGRIVGVNIFRKAFLNMDKCFTETLEVDNFALAQETNRITNFRIAY